MDLNDLMTRPKAEAGVKLTLLHPTTRQPLVNEDGIFWTITVVGRDSDRYFRALKDFSERTATNPDDARKEMPSHPENRGNVILAACTIGWSGLRLKGAEYPFSDENARLLYSGWSWVREQVDVFIASREAFLGNV